MHTFTQRPGTTQQTESGERTLQDQVHFGHRQQADEKRLAAGATANAPAGPGHDFGRMSVFAETPPRLQAKLTVSTPGDKFEQEADSVAERVMRMSEPQLMRKCDCGGDCPKCSKGLGGQKELQAKHVESVGAATTDVPPSVGEVTRSSGAALDRSTRQFMEPRFGYDFSQVRVHTDAAAQQSARDVRARAYTVGRDIVFAAGQYAPQTEGGQRLLAHELTHVAQQSAGQSTAMIQRDEDEKAQEPGQGQEQGDGDGPNPVIPTAPPPDSGGATDPAGGATPMGGGTTTPSITLETGNTGASPVNNLVHQQVCVDGYGGRKRCFSFAADGLQAPQFSSTWLGWSSVVVGALLHGNVYAPRPVPGASIVSTHSPTATQASNWLNYMTSTRLGLQDGYSVARHNCRLFSQWEFRDAPSHW
jgi:uncharacterized protein DUF4157